MGWRLCVFCIYLCSCSLDIYAMEPWYIVASGYLDLFNALVLHQLPTSSTSTQTLTIRLG